MSKTLTLTVPSRSKKKVPITVASGAIDSMAGIVEKLKDVDRCIVLYDKNLEDIALRVSDSLGDAERIAVPSGEQSKSFDQVKRITEDMLIKQATRKSLLICVGGGMLTDLGGFVASVFMRGMRCLHVPTSLLGIADAAIGGKTGIDLGTVKNMIGSMHHPEAIVIDIDVLRQLPDEQLKEGLVEVIKIAAILDSEFFGWLEENLNRILDREDTALEVCICNAVQLKVDVVEKDEDDAGLRQLLNFGHTVGHSIEALTSFGVSHGKAVSMGMVCEMAIAQTKDFERIEEILKRIDMPLQIPLELRTNALWDVMKNDKKNVGDDVRIAVPTEIGKGTVQSVSFEEFSQARV